MLSSAYWVWQQHFVRFVSANDMLPNTGHQNNLTKKLNQKQISILHLICHRVSVVEVFCCSF